MGRRDRDGSRDRDRYGSSRRSRDRDGRRGGGEGDLGLRSYIDNIYKSYRALWQLMNEETDQIRRHPLMRYASRTIRELDTGDFVPRRVLDKDVGTLKALQQFYDITSAVKDSLNKDYRKHFFRESGRAARRIDKDSDKDQITSRIRGGDTDRGDRDRRGRDRDD